LAHITMTVRKIKNSWCVDIRHHNVRYRKKSPENSKLGAQAYEAQLRQKLGIGGEALAFAEPDKKQKEQGQTFKEFSWKWFETYVRNNNKPSEINNKKGILRNHLVPFFGKTQMDKLSTLQVEKYKSKKIGEGYAKKSINCHLQVLSSCLHTAQDWLDLNKLPKMKKLKEPPAEAIFLSHEECNILLANSSGVQREIIFTALKTGLRLGELKALQWDDINWNNETLTVRHSWCEHIKGLSTPKSNRERHIPLTDELCKMLLQRRQASGFVFASKKSQRLNRKMLNRELHNICKKAGITKRVTCHTLRHTFASLLAMAGAPLKAVQELLGHSNIQTTMRYAHLSPSALKDAVSLLEPVKKTPVYSGHYRGTAEKYPTNTLLHFKTLTPELSLFKATDER